VLLSFWESGCQLARRPILVLQDRHKHSLISPVAKERIEKDTWSLDCDQRWTLVFSSSSLTTKCKPPEELDQAMGFLALPEFKVDKY
jgi:hypothetical protein